MSDYRKAKEDAARVCREVKVLLKHDGSSYCKGRERGITECIDAILALPEPQTEPVAIVQRPVPCDEMGDLWYEITSLRGVVLRPKQKLYAAPPSREWTDEEVIGLWKSFHEPNTTPNQVDVLAFARALLGGWK